MPDNPYTEGQQQLGGAALDFFAEKNFSTFFGKSLDKWKMVWYSVTIIFLKFFVFV